MKKILWLILLLCLMPTIWAKTYQIELVKGASEINNGTENMYLLTTSSGGNYYAWINGLQNKESGGYQVKENATLVTFNEDATEITIPDDVADLALWTFAPSANALKKSLDAYTLTSISDVNDAKNQIKFLVRNNGNNPTGFAYSNNSEALILEYKEGSFDTKIAQENDGKKYYVQFSSTNHNFVVSDTVDSSKSIKIYKVIETTNKIDKYKTNEEGKVNFAKTKTPHASFKETGVYQIDLELSAKTVNKNADVLFVLDYSNSMNTTDKINKLKNSTLSLTDTFLKLNPENRIGVIRFGPDIFLKEDTLNLGLTNDYEKVKDLINKDIGEITGGTNYTAAFEMAKEIFNKYYVKDRDQIIIFITDGAPTIYNKTKYSVFNGTSDNEVGAYATNWTNYVLKYELTPLKELKEEGVEIISVGVDIDGDHAITSTGSYVVKSEVAEQILKQIATNEENFYKIADYDKITEKINEILQSLKLYLTNATVTDFINKNYYLVTTDFAQNKAYVEIKTASGKVLEHISFSSSGKEAYSSLKENTQILNNDVLQAKYFTYDFKTKKILWNIERISEDKIILTYFIKPVQNLENYNEDDTVIDGQTDITYHNYDDKELKDSFLYEHEKSIENPQTGSVISYFVIIFGSFIGLSLIAIAIKNKKLIKL